MSNYVKVYHMVYQIFIQMSSSMKPTRAETIKYKQMTYIEIINAKDSFIRKMLIVTNGFWSGIVKN